MSLINISYKMPKRDEIGLMIENEFLTKECQVTYNELKKYLKNEGGTPVTTHMYTAIDTTSHNNIKQIIIDNPKVISINGGAEISVHNIFVVRSEYGGVEVYNLEINELLTTGQTLN